jgi:CBS domain-containing protein
MLTVQPTDGRSEVVEIAVLSVRELVEGLATLAAHISFSVACGYRLGTDSQDAQAALPSHKELHMNQLSEILDEKGHDVLRIDADASALDAVKRMVQANVGSLLVTESGKVIGIVTERDYLRRVTLEGRMDGDTKIREIISFPLIVATPETTIDECMALMTDRRIRHVPVLEANEVVGIVSIGDLVKFISHQQSFELKYLTEYITSH